MKKLFKKRIVRDLVCLAVLAGVILWLSRKYDALEWLMDFTRTHESWELDEFFAMVFFLSFAMAVFACRRWLESQRFLSVLEERNKALEKALEEIDYLKGILPICCSCKKIRDHKGDWQSVEACIEDHSKARFSHSMCPDCLEAHYGDEPWYKKDKTGLKSEN
ncbi:MAG: hypothetical protein HUN05_06410 [Desulfobacter sp.]|nr:MAG: hypothetical protein HUN05_06410 [Desulfobacter sp.]